jgi:hypothetical protein
MNNQLPIQPMNMNGGGFGGNGFMDIIKSQMLTMTMISSMNGNHNGGQNGNQNIYNLLYVFIITQLIDFFTKNIPTASKRVYEYYKEKLNNNEMLKDISVLNTPKNTVKTASITISVIVSDHENIIGQSILDYITNNVNTKHISYKKQNFVLNQKDTIEIYDEIFINLKVNTTLDSDDKSKSNSDIQQEIEVFSYTKTMQELRSFLNKISHEYKIKIQNKLGDKIYYFNQHPTNVPLSPDGKKDLSKLPNNCIFTMKEFQTNRKFTNLFGPEIDVVRKRVEFFMKNRKWYDSKGIPYTLGLLLSGQAGAGKTSTIKCLANETKRHIININLNNDITKTQLENLFFNEMLITINVSTGQSEKYFIPLDQRVYVLEDVDCQSDIVMERSLKKKEFEKENIDPPLFDIETNPGKKTKGTENISGFAEKIDLSFLLNLLDGVLENPGRIVIMTSNYPEMLDHALIRPGRIDVIADFKKCLSVTLIRMIEFFYDISLNTNEKNEMMELPDYIISPAEMGKLMFENFGDYTYVITNLKEISFHKVENATIEISTVSNNSNEIQLIDTPSELCNKIQPNDTPSELCNETQPKKTTIEAVELVKCESYSDAEYKKAKLLELSKTFHDLRGQNDNAKVTQVYEKRNNGFVNGTALPYDERKGFPSIDPNDKYKFTDYNSESNKLLTDDVRVY